MMLLVSRRPIVGLRSKVLLMQLGQLLMLFSSMKD